MNKGRPQNLAESLIRDPICLGIDIYAYATFTAPTASNISDDMARFVDRLQEIHPNLPLRTIPLEIRAFSPVQRRGRDSGVYADAQRHQLLAADAWVAELQRRFAAELISLPITDVPIGRGD